MLRFVSARRRASLGGLLLAVSLLGVPGAARSDVTDPVVDQEAAMLRSNAAIGRELPDLTLTDQDGQPFNLARYRGKPLVISMIYTSCPGVCPLTTEALAKVVDVAKAALGVGAFNVLSIGFDTRADTPQRLRAFALAHGRAAPNWTFATGDARALAMLSNATGFSFVRTSWGFDHIAQVSVIDGNGRVFKQVYGDDFTPPFLVEPLKQLVFGVGQPLTSATAVIDRVKFFCTVYDPATGRYRFDYSPFIAFSGGFLALLTVAWVALREWRRSRRRGQVA
ncbi:MAG: SCO family protein [Rhodospirillaceae bacterium]|nr:SCO family protein [Rhodospirillaceae bacterium]